MVRERTRKRADLGERSDSSSAGWNCYLIGLTALFKIEGIGRTRTAERQFFRSEPHSTGMKKGSLSFDNWLVGLNYY